MIENESEKIIRENCLVYLTRREHSQQELLDKLEIKGFDREAIQEVVNNLAEQGWQSDRRFAESYARFRIKKGFGPLRISYELLQRGVESFDLESVVSDLANDCWAEIIEQVYQKKYSDDQVLTYKEWLKRCRFLQQRGFSGEMIKTLFKQLNIQLTGS